MYDAVYVYVSQVRIQYPSLNLENNPYDQSVAIIIVSYTRVCHVLYYSEVL